MPIWEDDKIVGAVAIFQDRTEATAMAEELTGVRHLVEAMRAYTHEFINKLHIILGMIQLGQVSRRSSTSWTSPRSTTSRSAGS